MVAGIGCGGDGLVVECSGSDSVPSVSVTSGGSVSSSVPVSPSVSVSLDPVDLPSDARAHTSAGAKAFGAYVLQQADLAYVTADSSTLAALSLPTCETCQDIVVDVDEMSENGQHQVRR